MALKRSLDPDSKVFMDNAVRFLTGLNYSTSNASRRKDFDHVVLKKNFHDKVLRWKDEQLSKPQSKEESWSSCVRFVNALRQGTERGSIVVADADDIELLLYVLTVEIYRTPQVVEYYSYTGEFMELMRFLLDDQTSPFIDFGKFQAHRFYSYEIAKVQHYLDAGEDPQQYMDLPLSVRAEFASITVPDTTGWELNVIIDPQDTIERLEAR